MHCECLHENYDLKAWPWRSIRHLNSHIITSILSPHYFLVWLSSLQLSDQAEPEEYWSLGARKLGATQIPPNRSVLHIASQTPGSLEK